MGQGANTAKGAAGGAMSGAALGTMILPGWGTAIGGVAGGVIGGIGGYFSGGEDEMSADQRQRLMDYYNQVGGRQAPQVGQAQGSAYSGFRSNQSNLINRLEAMANGQGPSLAKQQFQQATDRNMRGQQAMAASGRGGQLAQLTAANNMGMLGANAAQGSALARTNEQMGAINQLGGVIAQGRGADESTNMFNAGQSNQFALANLDARLRTMGLNDEARLRILASLSGQNAALASKPNESDAILAGGASAFSQMAAMRAQQNQPMGQFGETAPVNRGPGGTPYNQQLSQWQNQTWSG